MNTITLPDHISFEEIALKWCESEWIRKLENECSSFNTFIDFTSKQEVRFYLQEFALGDSNWGVENQGAVACLDLSSRKLRVITHNGFDQDNLFQPILDFIKEKANA